MYTHTQILFWFILLKILYYKSLQHSEIDGYIQDDTGDINGAYDESEKRDSVGRDKAKHYLVVRNKRPISPQLDVLLKYRLIWPKMVMWWEAH